MEKIYDGYYHLHPTQEELALFYSDTLPNNYNDFDLLENQYLLIYGQEEEVIDVYKWTNNHYDSIPFRKEESTMFGTIAPKNGDIYQKLALDTLNTNQVSMICGPAGSGKTMLSLAYLFNSLEKGKIDHIVIFCNPVAAKNAAKLGFYPGTVQEKLLSTQVGSVLASKLGGMEIVEDLIYKGIIILMPVADARGYETPPHSGVYILEAQNLDTVLLRTILQRVDDTSQVIVDGDYLEQTDMAAYAGEHNGMRKMSEVFKGEDIYGQVTLKNIYRSKIADIAERMK